MPSSESGEWSQRLGVQRRWASNRRSDGAAPRDGEWLRQQTELTASQPSRRPNATVTASLPRSTHRRLAVGVCVRVTPPALDGRTLDQHE